MPSFDSEKKEFVKKTDEDICVTVKVSELVKGNNFTPLSHFVRG